MILFKNNKKSKILSIILGLGIAISLGLALIFTINTHQLKTKNESVLNQIANQQGNLNSLMRQNKRIVYSVTEDGKIDNLSQDVRKLADDIGYEMTTFTSAKDYNNNRSNLRSIVKDKNFFDTLMPSDIDSTGESYITTQHMKSQNVSSECYQMPNGRYLLVVQYVKYTKSKTITTNLDSLKSSYIAFTFTSDGTSIQDIKLIKGMTLTNED